MEPQSSRRHMHAKLKLDIGRGTPQVPVGRRGRLDI